MGSVFSDAVSEVLTAFFFRIDMIEYLRKWGGTGKMARGEASLKQFENPPYWLTGPLSPSEIDPTWRILDNVWNRL